MKEQTQQRWIQQVARNPRWGSFTTGTPQKRERRLEIQREQRQRRQLQLEEQQEHRLAPLNPTVNFFSSGNRNHKKKTF